MGNDVISVKDFDISCISFGDVKKINDKGGKYISMYYNKSPFVIQTPECYAPFGVNVYKDQNDNTESFSLELSFKERESREHLQLWYDILEQIDEKIIEAVMENSQQWIRKPKNRDVIQALFTPTIRVPTDRDTGEVITKWPATHRLKLPKDARGNFKCVTYDKETREEVPLDTLIPKMKGARVTAIASCGGIWIAGGKFGCSWKASQLMVKANTGISKFAFKDISDGEIQPSIVQQMAIDHGEGETTPQLQATVESSDDEQEVEVDDDDDEEEEEIIDEPVVVKKKSRSKKA